MIARSMRAVAAGFVLLFLLLGLALQRYRAHIDRCTAGHIEIVDAKRTCVDPVPRAVDVLQRSSR